MITRCLQNLSYESCLESHSRAAMHVGNDFLHTWTYAFLILRFFCICFLNIFCAVFFFQLVSCCLHSPLPLILYSSYPICHRNLYILLQYPLPLQTLQQPGFPFIHNPTFCLQGSVLLGLFCLALLCALIFLRIKRRKLF